MTRQKVLFIGDGLALTTGFATVIRYVAREFVNRGYDVHQLAALDSPPGCRSEPYTRANVTPWFPAGDVIGVGVARDVLTIVKPDLVFIICDPGQAYQWMIRLQQLYDWNSTQRPRTVLYSPIEGSPITGSFAEAFRMVDVPMTCTKWASDKLRDEWKVNVPFVNHGVDTHFFRPLDYIARKHTRATLGWSDSFIVSYVARNNGRKGHDRLIKAASIINDKYPDSTVKFYIHCKPFDEYILEGWDLLEMRRNYGVEDRVLFPSDVTDAQRGVSVDTLAMRLAASDLYISASSVEGFGLPTLEAMACGVPVIVPRDGANQEEVAGSAALAHLPACDWGTWHTGAELIHVDPKAIADGAIMFADPKMKHTLDESSKASLARAQSAAFSWSVNAGRIADLAVTAFEG